MTWRRKVAPIALAVAVGAGGLTLPATAATTSTHWTSKKCKSYARAYKKKHPHATPAQVRAANKTLKKHGCATRVRGG